MGIFDELKKKAESVDTEELKKKAEGLFSQLNETISKATDEISEKIGAAKDSFTEQRVEAPNVASMVSNTVAQQQQFVQQQQQQYVQQQNIQVELSCREKLLKVLEAEFPEYDVVENVSPATIGGVGRFMNYSIGVYKGETPKLFIMIIGKTTCAHREYRWSKEEAMKNHIEMINFVEHYPNTIAYITDRLHKYL